jgi:hypothetical protein
VGGSQLAAADELHQLCQPALAAANGAAEKQTPAMPDARRYRVTINIDNATHEVTTADPISEAAVAALHRLRQRPPCISYSGLSERDTRVHAQRSTAAAL